MPGLAAAGGALDSLPVLPHGPARWSLPLCPPTRFIDEKMEAGGVQVIQQVVGSVASGLFLMTVDPAHPSPLPPTPLGVDGHVSKVSLSLLGSP